MPAVLLADLRQALRAARRRPALVLLSVTTVALVVGAGSAVFAVANATLVRPLPFADADRLARIFLLPPGVTDAVLGANPLHPLDLVRLRERLTRARGPEGLWVRERTIGGDNGDEPESVPAASVTPGLFELLGYRPRFGRTFTSAEDRDGAPVVVIGDALWTRLFGGDRWAVGRTLTIDRVRHEVIGVMPPDFEPAYSRSELWTPLGIHAGNLILPGSTFIQNVVRLAPGATLEQLDEQVRQIIADVAVESPRTLRDWRTGVRSMREAQFGPRRRPLLLLLSASGALALIAVVNLMHLTLARVMSRRPETALRLALGAGLRDLVRAEVVEAGLVTCVGGLAGLLTAVWLVPAVLALDPTARRVIGDVSLDWRVMAFIIGLSFAVTMAAAILPVLRHAARRRGGSLVDTSRRATDTAGSARARAWLIGTETALALVLLSSAVLVYRAFEATAALHPGFDPEGVVAGQLRLSESAYASIESRTLLLDRVLEAVRAVPGVADAATTQNLFVPGAAFVTIAYPTESPQPGETGHTVQFRRISDGYFRTMRIPFEAGRDFDDRDRPATEPAVIVSRRFVDAYLGGGTPLGRRIRRGANPPLRIVGIVGDVSDVGYGQAPQPTLYVAYRQGSVVAVPITLVVRATGRALEAVSAIEAAVWSVDPAQPLANVTLLSQYLADSLGPDRFRSVLLGAFAGLGLLLASVGIFGVTARSVVERTREVGIRIALGGSAGAVWRTVAGRPLLAVGAGGLAGVGLSLVAARALSAYLPGLDRSAFDGLWPAAVVLAGCAVAAAVLPARRAARVDPLTALRVD